LDDVEHALSQIADIRARVVASTRFRGMTPKANLVSAALALAVAMAQSLWPDVLAQDPIRYVAIWSAVTLACLFNTGIETIPRVRALHGQMADAVLGAVFRQVLPFAAAGAVLDLVICRFAPDSIWLLPGLWQLLIGLFGFSALSRLPRAMVWVAGWYLACGAAVLVLAGSTGELSPWMMGIPFGIGQAAVAFICLYQAETS
jgi:hypothetical protein